MVNIKNNESIISGSSCSEPILQHSCIAQTHLEGIKIM